MCFKIKRIISVLMFFTLLGVMTLIAGRLYIIKHAEEIALDILQEAKVADVGEIIFVTQHVHEVFHKNRNEKDFSLLFRLRPYLTNERLPRVFRIPQGAIETIYPYGWCDNAARMAQFIFMQHGVKSKQWNMITPTAAHAALQVNYNEKDVFLDPFYGVVAQDLENNLLSAELAKSKKQKGIDPFVQISGTANKKFYKTFEKVMMSAQGEPLELVSQIKLDNDELKIGSVDGSSHDVYKDGVKNKISPHWTYIGHRYDRSWIRKLAPDAPSKVTFVLTKQPNKKAVTSNKEPIMSGNKLTWHLDEGEQLIFNDGEAGFLWGDLKSYIEVDQIIITPLGSAS